MATWHQMKAGLGDLYAKPAKGHKVVVNKPNEMAYSVHFSVKRKAAILAKRTGGVIISAKG